MSNYYNQSICESLQKIARETAEDPKPVTPSEAKQYFSSHQAKIPDSANDYFRRKREYRARAASANYGTY